MIRSAVFAALLLVLAMLPAHGAPAPVGLFTIVEGDVVVLREAREFAAIEGLPLFAEDIVRSRDSARLARIELEGGTLLDVGPGTEVLLQPRASLAAPADRGAALYLLRGWLKVSAAAAKGATGIEVASPRIGVAMLAGSVVMHAQAQAVLAFVESGRADAIERNDGKPGAMQGLSEGDAFVVRAAGPSALARRPPADLIEGLPRAFADTLPRRAAQWRGRAAVEPAAPIAPSYAELAPWLHAEPAVRTALVKRFSPLAHEPQFRASLVAELRSLPEWGRVLFPEKYRAKTAATASARQRAAQPATASTPPATAATQPPDVNRKANGMLLPPPPTADRTDIASALAQAPKTETP